MTEYARRVTLAISIDGHDVAGDFAPYLLDFTYTDNASGKADEVQLVLHDRDGLFSGDWMPKKGMPVEASIICSDWEESGDAWELPCGKFSIDEIEFSGPPDKVSIKAVSADLTGPLRDTRKTRAWENMSLEDLAFQIAGENGLELYYSGPEHRFKRQDQRNEGDIAFLDRLCNERCMYCKVHQGKIILLDCDEAEKADPVFTIFKKGGMYGPKSWSFRVSSAGTDYTDAEVAYCDSNTGTTHKATVKSAKKSRNVAGTQKTMTIQKRVESPEQASELGRSELHSANVKEQTSSIEIMGCPRLASCQIVELSGFGEFSGNYFLKSVTHKISGQGVYSTSCELTTPAPTEPETAQEEKSEAAEAAKEELAQAEQARIAQVKIYNPGEWPLSDIAGLAFHRLENLVEENQIKAQQGSYSDKIQAKTDAAILCLADIAEAEASRAGNSEDREGWLYLRDMFLKWLSADLTGEPDDSPLMVSWNWLWKFTRVRKAYQEFIVNAKSVPQTILNTAAQNQLGKIIFNQVTDNEPVIQQKKREYLAEILPLYVHEIAPGKIEFDFISSSWRHWEALYYALIKVRGWTLGLDGLLVALSSFSLRALAKGWAERQGGKWHITVEKVGVFAHDIFNFEESDSLLGDILGCWDCVNKEFTIFPSTDDIDPLDNPYTCLSNSFFRDFSRRYKVGRNFLVLSIPKIVVPTGKRDYDYPL